MVKSKAIVLVIITALLWSMGGFFVKFIDWNGISIAGGRSIIAAVFICVCLRRLPVFHRNKDVWLCALSYSLVVISFVSATKLTTAANAILLQYMAPVYVALLAPFILKEKTTRRDWLFIAIAMGGMVLFFVDSISDSGMEGNLLAIISGMCFAFFILFLRKVPAGTSADTVIWGNILAFLFCLPFMDFANLPSLHGKIALLAMGCLQLGLSYYLYAKASPHLCALELVVVPIIEPILNPVLVALLIHEIPDKWSIIGGIIVLCTISIWSVIKARKDEPDCSLSPEG